MRFRYLVLFVICFAALYGSAVLVRHEPAAAQAPKAHPANEGVEKIIVPFVTKHCVQCHGPKKKNADLVLHIYKDEKSILKDRKKWHEVMKMLHSGEMPPEKQPRPDLKDIDTFLKAVNDIYVRAD